MKQERRARLVDWLLNLGIFMTFLSLLGVPIWLYVSSGPNVMKAVQRTCITEHFYEKFTPPPGTFQRGRFFLIKNLKIIYLDESQIETTCDGPAAGCYDPVSHTIYLPAVRDFNDLLGISTLGHEMLHAMGGEHE